jgi:hypothetical protein
MAQTQLALSEALAVNGAMLLSDEELTTTLIELAGEAVRGTSDLEDLRELAAVCLVMARRLEAAA